MTALIFDDVAVSYGRVPVLHGLSLTVGGGECVGLVGESGCGKSTAALAALRALPRGGRITGGTIRVAGEDVTTLGGAALRALWARKVSMVYQDPGRALNPTMTIGAQMTEAFTVLGIGRARARSLSEGALSRVRIGDPARAMAAYPHALSGGMQQRVVIAMALAKDPVLLVLDEPTTGLDAAVEADILDLIDAIRRDTSMAVLLISHNLPLVGRMADRLGVLYAGVLVEEGAAEAVLKAPRHPYTARLLRCLPRRGLTKNAGRLETIPGALPVPGALPQGCVFAPRCHAVRAQCTIMAPPRHGPDGHLARCHFDPPFAAPADEPGMAQRVAVAATPILRVSSLGKTYRALDFTVRAVHDISFALGAGETLGLVGESGSGKTTLARMLLGLVAPDPGGAITLDGRALAPLLHQRTHADRKALQIIFQNPDSALNRAQRVRSILTRPLTRLARLTGAARARRLAELIEGVRLGAAQLAQLPRALSGGLKQRVAIARAFAGDPRLVVCDEPTSALDVSVQAAILNLLVDLQRRNAVAYIFISHDLNVVRYVSDRIAVLYRGNLVEIGPAEAVFAGPHHPYTAMLLSAGKGEARLPDSADLPVGGCVFQARCPRHLGAVCQTVEPALGEGTHLVRCHIGREYL